MVEENDVEEEKDKEMDEEEIATEEDAQGFKWIVARVVSGRLICIDKGSWEVTLQVRGGDGVQFEEDFGLPGGFGEDLFEELVDFLDSDVRVVLLDNTVVKIVRSESPEVWREEE